MKLPWDRASALYRDEGLETLVRKGTRYAYLELRYGWERGVRRLLGDELYFAYKIRKHTGFGEFSALADPFTTIEVDPADITNCSPHHSRLRWAYTGKIKCGAWDRETERFVDRYSHIHRMLRRHFDEGVPWEETEFIRDCKTKGRIWHGTSANDEIEAHCHRLDELYRDIERRGYKSKAELSGLEAERALDVERGIDDVFDEITVDIGRDGELLFVDGKHRLSIAKILSIETIPVRVCVRHKQWQELREEIASCDRIDELSRRTRHHLDHPDLTDLRGSLGTQTARDSTS